MWYNSGMEGIIMNEQELNHAGEITEARRIGKLEGIREVVNWITFHLFYTALQYDGSEMLHLYTNERRSAEKWNAKLKEWGVSP